ncbi:MAG: HlyD family efflux transporter periplasmic adaptor subunit [Planctomycetota bacterium]|nr:HlyD family efflux transporter periplasmic adaptor subunit [Planctomycetota bacterium]
MIVIGLAFFGAAKGFMAFKAMRKDSARTEGGTLAPLVRVQRAVVADYTEQLHGFGRARPIRTATVVAEVEGIIRSVDPRLESGTVILATENTTGGNGGAALPTLVTIDDRDLDDRLERARSEVVGAEAEISRLGTQLGSLRERLAVTERELEASERELERILPLVPKTLSRSDLDAQRIQVTIRERAKLMLEAEIRINSDAKRAAEARLDVLQRGVALAERSKSRARVAAPFAGRIEIRHVEIGERVKPGDPLFTIVDLSRIEVPVALNAARYDEVVTGAPASLRLPEHDEPIWEGTVTRVAPSIQAEQRIFFAYVVVEGSPGQNRVTPGAHLVAQVAGRTHEKVVAVPRRAFLGGRLFVAVPGPQEGRATVEERTPTVRRYLSGAGLVAEGLAEGELVLLTNLESVAEGSLVRVAPDAR